MPETALNVRELRHSFGERTLFDGVELGIHVGDRVGLIGDNGSGKSTLLRMIAGSEVAEAGSVEVQGGLRMAMLEQAPTFPPGRTGRQVLQEGMRPLLDAIAAYEVAAANADDQAEALISEIERLGGWDWEHRLERAAADAGVAVGEGELDASVETMSGGQKKRVALARLRLAGADVLLLDEPTNHLDTATVEAMETWLSGLPSSVTVIVVTHDRFFLEAVATRIVELREGRVRTYRGAYADYLTARADEEAQAARVQHRRLQILKTELEWARRSPKARTTKANARLERLDGLQEQQEAGKPKAKTGGIAFGEGPRLGKTILELNHVSKGFGGTGDAGDTAAPPLIDGLWLKLRPGDRLGVVGPNGCGKTTLLRLVLGELQPDSGSVELGVNTRPAYFDQHRTELDPGKSLKETLTPGGGDFVFPGGTGGRKTHVSSWLQRFAFDSRVHGMGVAKLSGGERNRLAIALFLLSDANLLLLDEPTNDLDLLTLNLFEEALGEFPGCLLVVSHDRYFLDKICTGVLGFGGGGGVTQVVGGYSEWVRFREREAAGQVKARVKGEAKADGGGGKASAGGKARAGLTYKEKRELEGIEARIAEADGLVGRLTEEYADPATWAVEAERGAAVGRQLQEASDAAEALYERWALLLEKS